MSRWCCVPNYLVLCLGEFVENSDLHKYALNDCWYRILKSCLPRFPHVLATANMPNSGSVNRSTAYQVAQVQIYPGYWHCDFSEICRFEEMRHLTIIHRQRASVLHESIWKNLGNFLRQMPRLQTIALNVVNIGTADDILHLPAKITSINLDGREGLDHIGAQFSQLLCCKLAWNANIHRFCSQMPNLRSLVLNAMPDSLECFTIMHHLESLTWSIAELSLGSWNQFARHVSPTLRKLHIDAVFINNLFSSPFALSLPFVTTFYLDAAVIPDDMFPSTKVMMPQLRNFELYLHGQVSIDWLRWYMLRYAADHDLQTLRVYFVCAKTGETRLTYYKGDSTVNTRYYSKRTFGLSI